MNSPQDKWTIGIALIGVAVNILAFSVLLWQIRLFARQLMQARLATDQDHLRRRKQATLEFYASITPRQEELRRQLAEDRDAEAILRLSQQATKDGRIYDLMRSYLNSYENVAVGVRTDVFDIEIVESAFGSRMRAIAGNYQPFIAQTRRILNDDTLWSEVEWLAEALRQRAEQR